MRAAAAQRLPAGRRGGWGWKVSGGRKQHAAATSNEPAVRSRQQRYHAAQPDHPAAMRCTPHAATAPAPKPPLVPRAPLVPWTHQCPAAVMEHINGSGQRTAFIQGAAGAQCSPCTCSAVPSSGTSCTTPQPPGAVRTALTLRPSTMPTPRTCPSCSRGVGGHVGSQNRAWERRRAGAAAAQVAPSTWLLTVRRTSAAE